MKTVVLNGNAYRVHNQVLETAAVLKSGQIDTEWSEVLELAPGLKILVIGANVWGSSVDSLDAAIENACSPKSYVAYLAPIEARVTDLGCVSYPRGKFAPLVICEVL